MLPNMHIQNLVMHHYTATGCSSVKKCPRTRIEKDAVAKTFIAK